MLKRGEQAQVAIEYLMVIGFSLFVITLLMILYGTETSSRNEDLIYSQISKIGNKIVDTSSEIYYRGKPARKTVKIYMPANVQDITVYSGGVVFTTDMGGGKVSDFGFVSEVPLQGQFKETQGIKYISIIADDGFVCIAEQGEPECP